MSDCMNKEQREYIENIAKDMLESTNMTKTEAHDFAFRCWQCGYAKAQEVRNNAIDDFVALAMNRLTDYELKDRCITGTGCKMILRLIAEMMKDNNVFFMG